MSHWKHGIQEGIGRIDSMSGNPIIMDRITTSMCEKAYGRASFVRVLVDVDAAKGLVDSIEVCYKSLGRSMELKVEYPFALNGNAQGKNKMDVDRADIGTSGKRNVVNEKINIDKMVAVSVGI
ncbi:hypothetical protein Tco_0277690 [Tanacetum coccineum]